MYVRGAGAGAWAILQARLEWTKQGHTAAALLEIYYNIYIYKSCLPCVAVVHSSMLAVAALYWVPCSCVCAAAIINHLIYNIIYDPHGRSLCRYQRFHASVPSRRSGSRRSASASGPSSLPALSHASRPT